jgi:hypothetical protein
MRRANGLAAIGWGGLIAGTLDMLAAFGLAGLRGRGPDVVLHYIASGVLGVRAFTGGVRTGALGLGLHFLIAFTAADFYWAASRRVRVLVKRPVIFGLLYGMVIYAVMNYVVVPLSRIGRVVPGPVSGMVIAIVVVMVCVGLPISLVARRYS